MGDNLILDRILNNCTKAENGIYYYNIKKEISYPEYGNDEYFGIEDESFWFNHRNNCIIEGIKKSYTKSEIVDIGGGNGFVSKKMQEEGYDVILVEPGNGVGNAKKRGIKNIVCGIFNKEMFKEKIENIGIFDVVEHIEDDEKILKDMNSVIAENGNLYLTVPAYKWLWSNEDDEVGHFRRYNLRELEELLKKSGFKIIYKTYFFSFLVLPLLLLRTIPSMLGIRKKSSEQNIKKEHNTGKVSKVIVDILCNRELRKIKTGKTIKFGTSCMIVAKKI